jgi:molecular chaperone DnaK
MYQASQAAQGGGEPGQGGTAGPKKDDVVDAEFQEVDDQDKKKRA